MTNCFFGIPDVTLDYAIVRRLRQLAVQGVTAQAFVKEVTTSLAIDPNGSLLPILYLVRAFPLGINDAKDLYASRDWGRDQQVIAMSPVRESERIWSDPGFSEAETSTWEAGRSALERRLGEGLRDAARRLGNHGVYGNERHAHQTIELADTAGMTIIYDRAATGWWAITDIVDGLVRFGISTCTTCARPKAHAEN